MAPYYYFCIAFLSYQLITVLQGLGETLQPHAAERWKMKSSGKEGFLTRDKELHEYLKTSLPEALQHTGSLSFDEHLLGVQAVLRSWESETHISDAGLFHSIYGTEGFQGFKLPLTRRPDIRRLIGEKAERLVWIFCLADRLSVDELMEKRYSCLLHQKHGEGSSNQVCSADEARTDNNDWTIKARIELGAWPIAFRDREEFLDFLELTLADWLEQVEGASEKANSLFMWSAGEAYSYRRNAYRMMADILSTSRSPRLLAAREMYDEVYKNENPDTKHLVQRLTPPMSQAAKDALAAKASIDM